MGETTGRETTGVGSIDEELRSLDFRQREQRIEAALLRIQLGSGLNRLGHHSRAIRSFRRGIIGLQGTAGHDRHMAHAWTGIAIAEWNLDGRGPVHALRSAKAGCDVLENSSDRDIDEQAISSEDVLGLCYFETGRHDLARTHYAAALRRAESISATQHYSRLKRRLALACLEVNDCRQAEDLLKDAEPPAGGNTVDRIAWLNGWALLCERTWRLDGVTRAYEEALRIFETSSDPPWSMAAIITNGALWFIDQQQDDLLQRALALIETRSVDDGPLSARIGKHRVQAARAKRRGDAATAL
ncbi:MAG TPA: tetratricopeptide repeat protein, partial [Hyphomicrobiaceae bacterium]|nr:tetratricopeptide repeat protein [Hyphomicrobiaceae bacterium]